MAKLPNPRDLVLNNESKVTNGMERASAQREECIA